MWLYGSGFPKSMNIGLAIDKKIGIESKVIGIKEHCKKDFKENNLYAQDEANKNNTKCFGYGTEIVKEAQNEWKGWGTQLKPSYEPIIVARKPFKGTVVDNIIKYGVGGINIDECRIAFNGDKWNNQKSGATAKAFNLNEQQREAGTGILAGYECQANDNGRFPANTILTYDQITFDEVCGGFPNTKKNGSIKKTNLKNSLGNNGIYGKYSEKKPLWDAYNDSGSAARYFYCAKASGKDRNEGLENFNSKTVDDGREKSIDNAFQQGETLRKNTHPTVKPTELMQYLIRLVTPKNGIVLDPFNGSGSTGKAVMYENKEKHKNYKYIGIELDKEYLDISKARIEFVKKIKNFTKSY